MSNFGKYQKLYPTWYNTERVLDDFIFLTFFLGNDFIPAPPTVDINKDILQDFFQIYCDNLPLWKGYLTNSGKIENIKRVQDFLIKVGQLEEQILFDQDKKIKNKNKKNANYNDNSSFNFQNTKHLYYKKKFGGINDDLYNHLRLTFLEALLWCLEYYFQGPPSWSWFYPFHYSPMMSDLVYNLPTFYYFLQNDKKFIKDAPVLPFHQLLATLPPISVNLLPPCYRDLVINPQSPLYHFFSY